MNLLDAKGYPMFGGVLASFRLSRPRAGLTIVARDRGILGNLIARAGSAIERLPLEDPAFEGVFEAYGTDQVGGRVVLTTTMLERLKAVDQLAHAHGFACAFLEEHLLIAFAGMNWRCPAWRIVTPVNDWLQGYAAWLTGLVDLPADIVRTLNLAVAPLESAGAFAPTFRASVPISGSAGQVLPSGLWQLLGEGGMSLIYVASGSHVWRSRAIRRLVRLDPRVLSRAFLVLLGADLRWRLVRRLRDCPGPARTCAAGLAMERSAADAQAPVVRSQRREGRPIPPRDIPNGVSG